MITAKEIADGLFKSRKAGDGYMACCPAHNDNNPSLSIKDGETGKPVVHCFAGCKQEDVVAALKEMGLWYTSPSGAIHARRKRVRRKSRPEPTCHLTARERAYIARYWPGQEAWFNDRPKVVDHPYAIRKGLTHACGAYRVIADWPFSKPSDCIVLPQRSPTDGYITGLQLINEEGQKKNVGRHGFMFLGSWEHPRAVIHVVEGWATAWAVLEDYHGPSGCIVAFGKQHMEAAAEIATRQLQRIPIVWNEPENYDYLDLRTDSPDLAAMHMRHAMTEVLARA